ncbi:MAG: T9SS type A sorting domain-containing protein [Candidatus Neomarinimicrobiota bacterium]
MKITPSNRSIKIIFFMLFILPVSLWSQTITDPVGDIQAGDPNFVDIEQIKFWQASATPDRIMFDFYTNIAIPRGNEVGIDATTIFEVYFDVDDNPNTGVQLEDIGYDYKLRINLFDWNGKNWIDGNVYGEYDASGLYDFHSGFFVFAEGNPRITAPYRFRWIFSYIGLKWPKVNWVARTYYGNHWADQVPDEGHATLEFDTTGIADVDTARGDHIEFIYPTSFQDQMDNFEILQAISLGMQIESQLCGTEYQGTQVVQFNPWLEGVAYSGNPISIGSWMWNEPPWFIVFHELGHNYTLAAKRFNYLYPSLGYDTPMGGDNWDFGTNFMEAWATMVGLFSMRELFTNKSQYQISTECAGSLEQNFNDMKNSYLGQLSGYEENPNYHILTPDLIDGIFLSLGEQYGYDIFPSFFKVLQPPDQDWELLDEINENITADYDYAKTVSMTITCCAFSVAADTDLRDKFKNSWNFPIDDNLYEYLKSEIEGMVNGIDDNKISARKIQFELLPNYPNPFNNNTVISYILDRQLEVTIKIYDLLGNVILNSKQGIKNRGYHHFIWEVSGIASGVYIYSIETNKGVKTKKCVFIQ